MSGHPCRLARPSDFRRTARRRAARLGAAIALVALTGCAGRGSVEQQPVGDAATAFFATVAGAPERGCELLAPATLEALRSEGEDCAQALAEAAPEGDLTTTEPRVEVFGRDAMVRWGSETLFLARFDDGWRVTAAGCRSRGEDLPFDCSVQGR